ncbi:dihydroorotate dehydrogenase electron transfer subunit [Evansella cellulosilytica]|uniref:Dihydroorotate dehydrogenase B (NAD(+)), electron transfer subunit n=1 Tax=Evansella cellulosilytica (strain ATCC 21833 / DSM 2522 / FERM P-1141 / JCM 9156 / N-4) TaxID=649639 RepID=E6TTQ4_EVAC2|nr:dihydroorotate dehydrogenase electron transfer subunit [Evansella cellulosilytica]ADU30823.1 oxidoreductase FAD/NAD(P)-binding domain protein [Evansella cellulosilytica DSM 2522]
MIVDDMRINEQIEIAPKIFKIELTGPLSKLLKNPGQFVNVRVGKGIDPTLRRPISICDVDVDNERLTMIYRVEGKGTKMLSEMLVGDTVNILGPLGQGFPVDAATKENTCVLVGGGVGIPPLYYLAKQLTANGVKVITILGFRSDKDIFLEKEFAELGELKITTEDGSKGIKGFVTDALETLSDYELFYTCGPKPMLRAVESIASSPGFISLEERMGCGVGACLACVCDLNERNKDTGKSYAKICSDGPVFEAGEVIL